MDSYSNEMSSKSGVASFHESTADGRFFQWLELTQRQQLRVFRRRSCATAVARFRASESHLQGVFPRKRCARCAYAQLRDERLESFFWVRSVVTGTGQPQSASGSRFSTDSRQGERSERTGQVRGSRIQRFTHARVNAKRHRQRDGTSDFRWRWRLRPRQIRASMALLM